MIHPNTELRFISPEVGYGVVATRLIPMGTITWALDGIDRVYAAEEITAMAPPYREILDKYCYRDSGGGFVLCWDHAKYVNHSFRSSCITTAYNFELAVRDIHPGEELTDDYGYLNLSEPFEALPEPGTGRTRVMPDDLLRYHGMWDDQLKEAFRHFLAVDQPLAWLIEPRYRDTVAEVAAGRKAMDSILHCYFDPERAGYSRSAGREAGS